MSLIFKCLGILLQIAGGVLVAQNASWSIYAFPVLLTAAAIWGVVAAVEGDWALVILNSAFAIFDLAGIWRWFGPS
jgi:hypothetical protein